MLTGGTTAPFEPGAAELLAGAADAAGGISSPIAFANSSSNQTLPAASNASPS